ncbi:MAG: hypothetical protein ACK40K_07915, partial [Raineya sp.]
MKKILLVYCFLPCLLLAQNKENTLEKILYLQYDKLKPYLENSDYQIQIVYSQIIRDSNNFPKIFTY